MTNAGHTDVPNLLMDTRTRPVNGLNIGDEKRSSSRNALCTMIAF